MSSSEISKPTPCPEPIDSNAFDPAAIEKPWYQWWRENGFFHAEVNPEKEAYTIVIPPPNVTGALHLGHALNNTLQDILIRIARMKGFEAMWLPGTDHAGIATQTVVERRLWEEEQKTRHDLGREALIEKIWEWKEVYEKRILGQLQRLGCSLDWERTQFTMSVELSRAVRHVFLELFKDGLIYRGKRLINWSPGVQSALSNDELVYRTVQGNFWYINYPLEGKDGEFIQVATTRPETMLGDTAVAVHPDPEGELNKRLEAAKKKGDAEKVEALEQRIANQLPQLKKFASLIGTNVVVPLINRTIPIVGDAILADPEKGTGAVKVTPAHDPNDYACGKRNNLPMINILNPDGTLNEETGLYEGLFGSNEGRKKVVADLEEQGFLAKTEDHEHEVAHCYRTDVPIEPYLSDQWFVNMQPLVDLAKDCYTDGNVKFYPEQRGRDYMRWLDSTPDWCISRQLWWGHRIPVWFKSYTFEELGNVPESLEDGISDDLSWFDFPYADIDSSDRISRLLVDRNDETVHLLVCVNEGHEDFENELNEAGFAQDEDVLDTWFSSQLWPLSTLGWPEETEELKYFYPTNVLVTARDILALWVARMVMMGMKFREETPYHHVLINGTVQDERGDIMSKSRGNGFDPVRVIDGGKDVIRAKRPLGDIPKNRVEYYPVYGTDSLRYGLSSLTSGNAQDIRLQVNRERRKKKEDDLAVFDVSIPRFEEGRRFCNKIWQASRGVVFRQCENYTYDDTIEALEDRWLYHRLNQGIQAVEASLEVFDLGSACDELYRIFWDDFCSWYLEVIKPRLWGNYGEASKAQAQTHLVKALDTFLRLLHPYIPMITEALWQELQLLQKQAGQEDSSAALMLAEWPKQEDFPQDEEAASQTDLMRQITAAINQMRSQQPGLTDKTQLPQLLLTGSSDERLQAVKKDLDALQKFLRVDEIQASADLEQPALSAASVVEDIRVYVPLAGLIDVDAEIERLKKQLATSEKNVAKLEGQLGNEGFVSRAPAEVVEQSRERLANEKETITVVQEQLAQLAEHAS
ncbi:MAG: valine--tRNA ligase [Deltaproteobacteria bacterium]|nr:MAG: valine--tRNA ligase [Deltaproteobacteria bacterium]